MIPRVEDGLTLCWFFASICEGEKGSVVPLCASRKTSFERYGGSSYRRLVQNSILFSKCLTAPLLLCCFPSAIRLGQSPKISFCFTAPLSLC